MKREKPINVPKGIKFLSEWQNFSLPQFPHILNKQITGCGFTQWCLTNDQNIILCSPRRVLLENKEDQYLEECEEMFKFNKSELPYRIFYARNEYEKVIKTDVNLNKNCKIEKINSVDDNLIIDYIQEYKQKIKDFYYSCIMSGKKCKILVTYDSFRKVKETLEELKVFDQFHIIIDEFQSIFTDSRFKATTEMEFVNYLQGISKVCYASATPMMDKYLDKIDEFKDLPYYELDWGIEDSTRLIKPKISSTPCNKINQQAIEIIEKYRTGQWRDIDGSITSWINKDGKIQEIQSKEAVFYINSVKNICDIIRLANLKQEECNILTANTDENKEAIRKAFKIAKKDFQGLGKVPKKSEMHLNKMFTFCTRTVYLGADFYSTNARSFIFSDANIDSLAVDITLDLPQILGRQRYEGNPWKNELNIYFKPTVDKNIVSKEDFDNWVNRKKTKSNTAIEMFNESLQNKNSDRITELLETYETIVQVEKYKNHYVSIDKHSGSNKILKFNNLVLISEQRAFDIQQIDYADRCKVRSNIDSQFSINNSLVSEILKEFDSRSHFIDKMRYLCLSLSSSLVDDINKNEILRQIDTVFSNYYITLGPERIYSLSYRRDRLEKEYNKVKINQFISPKELIYSKFNEGDKLSNKEIKEKLKDIYDSLGYKKSPVASDLREYFELGENIKVKDQNGKWVRGIELIKKKE